MTLRPGDRVRYCKAFLDDLLLRHNARGTHAAVRRTGRVIDPPSPAGGLGPEFVNVLWGIDGVRTWPGYERVTDLRPA